jgi:hypothetical protein
MTVRTYGDTRTRYGPAPAASEQFPPRTQNKLAGQEATVRETPPKVGSPASIASGGLLDTSQPAPMLLPVSIHKMAGGRRIVVPFLIIEEVLEFCWRRLQGGEIRII